MDTWICGYLVTKWILRFVVTEYLCFCVSVYPRIHLFLGVALKCRVFSSLAYFWVVDPGEGPPCPLFFKPNWGLRLAFPPPLTEGLDLPLLFNAIHVSGDLPVNFPIKLIDFHCIEFILLLSWYFCGVFVVTGTLILSLNNP